MAEIAAEEALEDLSKAIDDERRRQAELRRIKRLHEDTAQMVRIGHWEWDQVEDRCSYCSPQNAEIHGLSVAAYLERTRSVGGYISLVHPDDRLSYQRSLQRHRRERARTENEHRVLRDDGAVVPVRASILPVLDRNGRLWRSFGIVQDISTLKRSEESLQHSEAFLRQAARLARLGTWIWDEAEDRLAYGSDALAEILGYTPDQLRRIACCWAAYLELVHPDDRAGYERLVRAAVDRGTCYDVVYRVRTGGGGYRYCRECGEPELDEKGRHVRTLGSLQDIDQSKRSERALAAARTELERKVQERTARLTAANLALQVEILARRRAEGALRESEQRLRAIVDNSPSAIFLKDRRGRFQVVNARFVEWYGIPREQLIGKASDELSSSRHLEVYASLNREVLRTGEVREHTLAIRFADGCEHPLRITKFPVRGEDGEMIGIATFQTELAE